MRSRLVESFVLFSLLATGHGVVRRPRVSRKNQLDVFPEKKGSPTTRECLYIARDLPPCDFDSLDDSSEDTAPPATSYPADFGGQRSPRNVGDSANRVIVYSIEGCVPSRLPFAMPSCQDENSLSEIVEVRKLYPFTVNGLTKSPLVFPEFDFDRWARMIRQLRKRVSDNLETGRNNFTPQTRANLSPPVRTDDPAQSVSRPSHDGKINHAKSVPSFHAKKIFQDQRSKDEKRKVSGKKTAGTMIEETMSFRALPEIPVATMEAGEKNDLGISNSEIPLANSIAPDAREAFDEDEFYSRPGHFDGKNTVGGQRSRSPVPGFRRRREIRPAAESRGQRIREDHRARGIAGKSAWRKYGTVSSVKSLARSRKESRNLAGRRDGFERPAGLTMKSRSDFPYPGKDFRGKIAGSEAISRPGLMEEIALRKKYGNYTKLISSRGRRSRRH